MPDHAATFGVRMMAASNPQAAVRAGLADRASLVRLSGSGWGVLGATAVFIGLTCWWLTQDRSVPVYDAGFHLERAIYDYRLFQAGDLVKPFVGGLQYPPLVHLVGALAAFAVERNY